MVLRALILYRRRRIINHLLTYLLTYLLILLTALQSEGTSQNLTNCYLHINNKHPRTGGHFSRPFNFGVDPRDARAKIQTYRTHVPSFVDVGPAVSEPQDFENIVTARTDRRMDI